QAEQGNADGHHYRHGIRAARRTGADRRRHPGSARGRLCVCCQTRGGVGGELADSLRRREGRPMSALLNSVRADLLDRRMRPFLALAVAALVAALLYALLGGGGGATAPVLPETGSPSAAVGPSGIAVTAANSSGAAAEVSGAFKQHGGSARNPFAPLPGSSSSPSSSPSSSS